MSRGTWTETDPTLNAHRDRLVETLRGYGRVAVAYSGGVDSTVVAMAAYEALGDAAIAVTAVSDSLAAGELEEAQELARTIGIRHRVIRTEEFADPNYLRNQPDRCYFCKSELYGRLSGLLGELDADVIASGANTDDLGDHRPGMRAAAENGVRHPLAGMRAGQARGPGAGARLGAAHLGQAGDPVPLQPDRLRRGSEPRTRPDDRPGRAVAPPPRAADPPRPLPQGRPGPHRGPARRPAPAGQPPGPRRADRAFRALGFKFVTLDLEGFRSGSFNSALPNVVPVESLLRGVGRS